MFAKAFIRTFVTLLVLSGANMAAADPWQVIHLDGWTSLAPGQERQFVIGRTQVILRHRTAEEVGHSRAIRPEDLTDPFVWLADPTNPQDLTRTRIPATDENIGFGPDNRFVLLAIQCDSFMPIPLRDAGDHGDFGGYFCQRTATHHDSSGRATRGYLFNMPTMPVEIVGDTLVIKGPIHKMHKDLVKRSLGWD